MLTVTISVILYDLGTHTVMWFISFKYWETARQFSRIAFMQGELERIETEAIAKMELNIENGTNAAKHNQEDQKEELLTSSHGSEKFLKESKEMDLKDE